MSSRKNHQSGFAPILIIIIIGLIAGSAAVYYYTTQKPAADTHTQAQLVPTATLTPTPSLPEPTLTKAPTPKPTSKPSPTKIPLTPSPTSSPQASIRFEPASINISRSRNDLGGDKLPTIKLYDPGHHKGMITADNSVGIYAYFKGSNNQAFGEFTDSQEFNLGFVDAYGQGIKSGENKVNLQFHEGDDIISAVNNSVVVSIPVTINITD